MGQAANLVLAMTTGDDLHHEISAAEREIEISQVRLLRRAMRPNEIPDVRRVYWAQAAQGTRLPAERGVILIDGGLS